MKTQIVQIGLCSADLAGSVRRYCDGFGFKDAGGRMLWGARTAKIQGLGDDATGEIWWLVGAQPFLNLEFFHHSLPAQRPLPAGWSPSAFGWVRWGFAVADFDAALAFLDAIPIAHSRVVTINGLRRLCFRDPDIGVPTEVFEEGEALAGSGECQAQLGAPRIVYATLSVNDLDAAAGFYCGALMMNKSSAALHGPDDETLWGLTSQERDTLLLDGGRGMFLELVCYSGSHGERRSDMRLSDQGIMNIALGWRDRSDTMKAIDSAVAAGAHLNAPLGDAEGGATYINDPAGHSVELLFMPERLDPDYGWKSREPAFR